MHPYHKAIERLLKTSRFHLEIDFVRRSATEKGRILNLFQSSGQPVLNSSKISGNPLS